MKRITLQQLDLLQFERLASYPNLTHAVTLRNGYDATNPYSHFNVATQTGDTPQHVAACRGQFAEALAVEESRIIIPTQRHTAQSALIDADFLSLSPSQQLEQLEGVDALITAERNCCIGISTADCVPILLYDTQHRIVAAIHAGWRGTVAHIAHLTVERMVATFGTDPRYLEAAIAPAIGFDAFEVGDEVVAAFTEAGFNTTTLAHRHPTTGKYHLHLPHANRDELLALGIPPHQIEESNLCTHTHYQELFSARREGIASGRILSAIMLR